jgi:anti-sigma factor RsiW
MDCKLVRAHLDAYLDGELEPTPVIEFEQHLDACAECRSELALGRLLKRGVAGLPVPTASDALRRRIALALDETAPADGAGVHGLGWPRASALAVAASVALAIGAAWRTHDSAAAARVSSAGLAADTAPFGLLGDIVARHTDQLPTDIAAQPPEQVTSWFRGKVGFRVRSVEFTEPEVRFVGARVSQIGNQLAAKLYYSVGDSRLTTVIFQPPASLERALSDDQLVARWGGRRAQLGTHVVTYRSVQGYTVPIFEHDGIAYAFTGDLDQRHLLQLVGSARLP